MTHFQLCFTWAPSKGYRRSLCDWNQPVITFNNKIRLANDSALIRHHEEFKFFQIFRFHGEGIDSKHYGVLFFHEKFCQAVLICNLIMHHHILDNITWTNVATLRTNTCYIFITQNISSYQVEAQLRSLSWLSYLT